MRHFNIRIVRRGDRYGLNWALTHQKDEAMVEFYDATHSGRNGFGELGQFVGRYYIGTLLDTPALAQYGLDLDGGIPEWSLSPEQFRGVRDTLEWIVDRDGPEGLGLGPRPFSSTG